MNSENSLMPFFGVANIFPIKIFRVDCSKEVDSHYVKTLTDLIDDEIEKGHVCDNDPRHQTSRNLFLHDQAQLIKELFVRSVRTYIANSPDSFNLNLEIEVSDCRGWGFRSNKESNNNHVKGPWHNHSPSPITGVFYLKSPKDDWSCGTEFNNPLGMFKSVQDVAVIDPLKLNWIIFPGWLQHRSVLTSSNDYRYIIAADCFLKYGLRPL